MKLINILEEYTLKYTLDNDSNPPTVQPGEIGSFYCEIYKQ